MPGSDSPSSRIPWLKLGVETFFVILGVFLALALDEWRQARREREVVVLALQNIQAEIEDNRKQVREALAYHRELLGRLEKTPRMKNVAFRLAILRNNAWQAAQSSQAAARMDFPSVAAFSKMAELQELYQGVLANLMPLIYAKGSGSGQESPASIFHDLIYFEQMLLQAYDEAERVIPKD